MRTAFCPSTDLFASEQIILCFYRHINVSSKYRSIEGSSVVCTLNMQQTRSNQSIKWINVKSNNYLQKYIVLSFIQFIQLLFSNKIFPEIYLFGIFLLDIIILSQRSAKAFWPLFFISADIFFVMFKICVPKNSKCVSADAEIGRLCAPRKIVRIINDRIGIDKLYLTDSKVKKKKSILCIFSI